MRIEYIRAGSSYEMRIPPPPKRSVERVGLLSDMAGCGQSLFVISGSAGYGKTELVRQYCEKSGAAVVWCSMDGENTELPFQSEEAEAQFSESSGDPEKLKCIFVIDNYEDGKHGAFLEEMWGRVLADQEHLRLILITRDGIPESLSRLVARGDCRIIGEEKLAFQRDEGEALVRQTLRERAQGLEKVFAECAERLEGWPLGLALVLLHLERAGVPEGPPDWPYLMQASMIEDFLGHEVFERQPPELQDFLLRTAAPSRISAELCEQVLGFENARGFIRTLVRKNLLIHTSEGGVGEYRYRHIFRLFLNERAADEKRRDTVKRAADYYLKEKELGRAVREALEINYTELIVRAAETCGEELLLEKNDQILGCCVEYLAQRGELSCSHPVPETAAGRRPELLGVAAQYYYKTGEWSRAEPYLNQADSSFGKENKFAAYRGLYRGLLKYREDPVKYKKQVSGALFVLRENQYALPYLRDEERALLFELEREESSRERESPRLKAKVFGDFQVWAAGESRQLSWRTKKSRELFACLLDLNGAAVGRKQLLLKLWGDELPNNGVTMLHNMLYSIRRELSAYQLAELICYRDKLYSIDMGAIETDLTEIRELCALVDRGDIKGLEERKQRFMTYWGRYLEDLDCQWSAEAGEYYDTRFFSGCVMMAGRRMAEGDYAEAVTLLKNALLVNPYSEEQLCSLLRCYAAMKNLKLVKNEYNKFRELLKHDLNVEPGKEVELAYQSALTG